MTRAPEVAAKAPAPAARSSGLTSAEEAQFQDIVDHYSETAAEPVPKAQTAATSASETFDTPTIPPLTPGSETTPHKKKRPFKDRYYGFVAWGMSKLQTRKGTAEPERRFLHKIDSKLQENKWYQAAARIGFVAVAASAMTLASRTTRAVAEVRYGIHLPDSGANHGFSLVDMAASSHHDSNNANIALPDPANEKRTALPWKAGKDCLWNWYKQDLAAAGADAGLSDKEIGKITHDDNILSAGVKAYVADNSLLQNSDHMLNAGDAYNTEKAHNLAHRVIEHFRTINPGTRSHLPLEDRDVNNNDTQRDTGPSAEASPTPSPSFSPPMIDNTEIPNTRGAEKLSKIISSLAVGGMLGVALLEYWKYRRDIKNKASVIKFSNLPVVDPAILRSSDNTVALPRIAPTPQEPPYSPEILPRNKPHLYALPKPSLPPE